MLLEQLLEAMIEQHLILPNHSMLGIVILLAYFLKMQRMSVLLLKIFLLIWLSFDTEHLSSRNLNSNKTLCRICRLECLYRLHWQVLVQTR
jgi:hypothetical protein